MNSNIFNKAFKTSTISLKRLNLIYDHFYQEPRFTIPFIGVEDRSEFNFSIIFNASYSTPTDTDFGNSARFSLYRKFTKSDDGDSWTVKTCDEYTETFKKTGQSIKIRKITYYIFLADSQPLKLYVSADETELRIVDSAETHIVYKTSNDYSYPEEIYDRLWNYVTFQDLSNGFRYFNELDFIDFIKDSTDGYIKTINVYHHNTKTAVTRLTYENGTITKAKLYRIKNSVETLVEDYEFNYDFAYDTGYFKEKISNEVMITEMDWSNGLLVQKGVGLTESNKSKYEVLSLFKKYTSTSSNPDYRLKHYYVKNNSNFYHSYDADSLGNVSLSEVNAAGYSIFGGKVSYDETLEGNTNLLSNGSFTSSTTGWTIASGSVTISNSTSIVDPCNVQCPKEALISAGCTISQSVTTSIKPNEGVKLSFFYCDEYDNEGVENDLMGIVKLELTKSDNSVDTKEVELYHGVVQMNFVGSGSYGFKCLEFVAKEEYKAVKLIVENNTELPFLVKGFKLTKGNIGRTYTYDSLNRLTGISSINETKYFSDENGNVVGEFSSKRNYKEHNYGDYNILLETKDNLGNHLVNTYDSYYYNRIIKAINYYDNYYQQTNTSYTNLGKDVLTETGINGKTTTYNKNTTTRLMDSITDPKGIVYSHLYDSKNLNIKNTISLGDNSSSVSLDYYSNENIKEYVNGDLKYLFTYNDQGKLKKVEKIDTTSNETEVLTQLFYDYELDTTKLISDKLVKIIDRSGFVTLFEYDLFGNVVRISRNDKIYVFEYDSLQRIVKIYETNSDEEILNPFEYHYDIKSQLIKAKQNEFVSEYIYDEEGKVVEKLFGESSTSFVEKINNTDSSKKNLYCNKLAMHSHNGYGCFFEKSKSTGLVESQMKNNKQETLTASGIVTGHNGVFGYLNCSTSTSMSYGGVNLIGMDLSTTLPLSTGLSLAFKVESGQTGGLFCLRFVNNVSFYGKIEVDNTRTYLNIYGQGNSSPTLLYSSDISSKLGKWISIGFSHDENAKLTTFVCDNQTFTQKTFSNLSLVEVEASLYLGCLNLSGSTFTNKMTCKITNVILTKTQLTQDEMLDINNENINFLNQDSLFLNKENNTNFAQSLTLKNEVSSNIYPLNRTLKNRSGSLLTLYKKKFGEELYEYNPKLKDYAFNARGNLLYAKRTGSSITVMANVCFESITASYGRQILEIVDGNTTVELYKGADNKLYLGYRGAVRQTGFTLEDDTWATISVGIEPVLSSDSIDTEYYNFRVSFNGQVFETQISTGTDYAYTFNSFNVYLGGGYSSSNYIMRGHISDVYIVDSYLSSSSIDAFTNNDETIVYHEYNSIGQLIEEGIKTRNSIITKKTYQYDVVNNRDYGNIVKVIEDGVEKQVEMDEVGNITKLGNVTYTYDYLNRLKSMTGSSYANYEYDDKGNIISITKNGSTRTFTYDNDKLLTYGGNQVTYDDFNRMTGYGSLSFGWTGKQLTSLTISGVTYTYEYNQHGLRTKKTNNSTGAYVSYTYEGDKLVKQYDGTNKVFYLYDENGLIYGLIWNGSKYFYKRDLIGEIIDIIDCDGTAVVTYEYDPYGKLMSTTGTLASTLGKINSVLYKAYIYDHESGLYYCISRFYSTELCRWISTDSIKYLDSRQIDGLNLYCYCMNNPVNYSDGSGHFPILCTLLFLGGLGALTSIASQAVTDIMYGNEFDVNNYLIAAGAGFLGGLCYAIPVVGGIVAGAVTSGLTTAGQMIYSGEDYSVADYVINIGMSAAIGGATSFLFGKATSKLSYFADTDFFLSNLVKFAGNYGGITLQNSVVNQLMGQLIVRGVVTGTISNMFSSIFQDIPSKTSDYYHLRKMGLDPWDSFRYAYF